MTSPQMLILDVIGTDSRLKRVAATNGEEYAGPCPFCGGTDRFRVWPNHSSGTGRWWCRQCRRNGDPIAYLVERGSIDKSEAYQMRHGTTATSSTSHLDRAIGTTLPAPFSPNDPPKNMWQHRGKAFAQHCETDLWNDTGVDTLAWLNSRGLHQATIRQAALGYNPQTIYESREIWGLSGSKKIYLPQGLTIPWQINGDLWRINIRRLNESEGSPKYIGPAGFGNGLYGAGQLRRGMPAILVEGELDALTIQQEAGSLITACATGSASGSRRVRWIAKLALCSIVLTAFDDDPAGEEARRYWLDALPNARYWRPYWDDVNAMHQEGVMIQTWVRAGLGRAR